MNEKRGSVVVHVFNGWPFEDEPKLSDVVTWFTEQLENIPSDHRDHAECEMRNEEHDYRPTIEISYRRPETDAEYKERNAREEVRQLFRRRQEIAELRALREKYPDAI